MLVALFNVGHLDNMYWWVMLSTCISYDLWILFYFVGQFGTRPTLANPTLAQNVQHPVAWLGG